MRNKVLSHDDWIRARKSLLTKEKDFTKLRDKLCAERQQLPWESVDKDYVFEEAAGPISLSELFNGRSQLIVYHFMYGPDWETGCKSCSFIADHFNPAIVHLNQRDVSFVAVSRAPIETLQAYEKRMGWNFRWVSSQNNDFNWDYHVSFTDDAIKNNKAYYNFKLRGYPVTEAPGASVFYKDKDGGIYHTYSVFERGLDMFITAYHYLDIVPKGRDEGALGYTMDWLRRHDEYDD